MFEELLAWRVVVGLLKSSKCTVALLQLRLLSDDVNCILAMRILVFPSDIYCNQPLLR